MPLILLLLVLLPMAYALGLLTDQPVAKTIPLVLLGVAAGAYLLALANLLWLAPYCIWLCVGLSATVLVRALFIKRSISWRFFASPSAAVFALLAAGLWLLCRGRLLTSWDDFSHWGLVAKIFYYQNSIYPSAQKVLIFPDYPPATAVYLYSMLKAMCQPFREDVALFCQAILCLGLALAPMAHFEKKRSLLGGVMVLVAVLVPAGLIYETYFRLLVDGLMGVLVAYVLLTHFLPRLHNSKRLQTGIEPGAVLGCFVLAVVKPAGIGLAAMVAAVLLCDAVLQHRKTNWKRGLLLGAAPLAAALVANTSWSVFKTFCGIEGHWSVGVALADWVDLFAGRAPAYRYTVLENFAQRLFFTPENGFVLRFSSAGWGAWYLLLVVVTLLLLGKKQRRTYLATAGSAIAIHLVFMLSLFYSYLFVFSPGEAVALASFERYEYTAVTAVLIVLFSCLLYAAAQHRRALGAGVSAMAGLVLLLCCGQTVLVLQTFLQLPEKAAQTHHDRYLTSQTADRIRALAEEEPRVYLVSIIDQGRAMLMTQYELYPVRIYSPEHTTSIAIADYYDDGVYTQIISAQEWGQLLYDEYDYVYLYSIDGYFTTYYRDLFEDEDDIVNDTMVRVIRHSDGSMTLRNVNAEW